MIQTKLPKSDKEFREAIYEGDIFLTSPNTSTIKLATYVREIIIESLGSNFRSQIEDSPEAFFKKISQLRSSIFSDTQVRQYVRKLISSNGLDPASFLFEPPKLRAVSHDGHHNPAAAPVYFGHRDTWYATPQSTINFWIPLSDLSAQETFAFYPEVFDQKIPNNSSGFYFETDQLNIGWENKTDGLNKFYPTILTGFDVGRPIGFAPSFASLLMFSGSHYHQTLKQSFQTTRFSFDFRLVHIEDEKNQIGAPNVDNDSHGSCLATYLKM